MQPHEYIQPFSPAQTYDEFTIGNKIEKWNREEIPENSLLILGLSDQQGSVQGCSKIRDAFYKLYAPRNMSAVYDLGDIISVSVQDRLHIITQFTHITNKKNNTLLLISEEGTLWEHFYSHGLQDNKICLVTDQINPKTKPIVYNQFINNVFHKLTCIGVQAYFTAPSVINHPKPPDLVYLGQIRDNIQEIEPYFRAADKAFFSLEALRVSDFPENSIANPNGLYAEEICQLAWYAGNADNTRYLGIESLTRPKQFAEQSHLLAAQVAWFFLSGFNARKGDDPKLKPDNFKQYHIQNNKLPESIVLYKSEGSGKYWMQYGNEPFFIPCSQNDKNCLLANDIPDRLWQSFK